MRLHSESFRRLKFLFWKRDEPALWKREGHEKPVSIRVMFNEKPRVVDVDGFVTTVDFSGHVPALGCR